MSLKRFVIFLSKSANEAGLMLIHTVLEKNRKEKLVMLEDKTFVSILKIIPADFDF